MYYVVKKSKIFNTEMKNNYLKKNIKDEIT